MGYGALRSSDPATSHSDAPSTIQPDYATTTPQRGNRLVRPFLLIFSVALIAAVSTVLVIGLRTPAMWESGPHRRPAKAISRACSRTRYPVLCADSLLDFPDSQGASEHDLVRMSVNLTLRRFNHALSAASKISNLQMDTRSRAAYDNCLVLLADSVDLLARSLGSATENSGAGGSAEDVMTWLSAALTYQEACAAGFKGVSGAVRDRMVTRDLRDLSELVSNCLALLSAAGGGGNFGAGLPMQNRRQRRRLMAAANDEGTGGRAGSGYPGWMSRKERELLEAPVTMMRPDIVVSKDGNGTVTTIEEAINRAPENGNRYIIIYVKAGRYMENNLEVGRKKKKLMLIGDGKHITVITSWKNAKDNPKTFLSATFAAKGDGFIARDITFENTAGPAKHQALALVLDADHCVVFRCSIEGHQDTLYLHSLRQFLRECDIYGTVDFIYGNAVAVLQNCNIYARKPMPKQKNIITAQGRTDPNQNTGFSIHACQILAHPELEASKGSIPTYLGRPWMPYARVVYMKSYLGDHINPRGWLAWDAKSPVDKLYYGEYMNSGPGAPVGQRVKWPGYQVITSPIEASKFTVAQFISGSMWLPSTNVPFALGL